MSTRRCRSRFVCRTTTYGPSTCIAPRPSAANKARPSAPRSLPSETSWSRARARPAPRASAARGSGLLGLGLRYPGEPVGVAEHDLRARGVSRGGRCRWRREPRRARGGGERELPSRQAGGARGGRAGRRGRLGAVVLGAEGHRAILPRSGPVTLCVRRAGCRLVLSREGKGSKGTAAAAQRAKRQRGRGRGRAWTMVRLRSASTSPCPKNPGRACAPAPALPLSLECFRGGRQRARAVSARASERVLSGLGPRRARAPRPQPPRGSSPLSLSCHEAYWKRGRAASRERSRC